VVVVVAASGGARGRGGIREKSEAAERQEGVDRPGF
jgi:hypothetical protein